MCRADEREREAPEGGKRKRCAEKQSKKNSVQKAKDRKGEITETKRKQHNTEGRARASLSVEAAYIMSFVLLCLALLIRYGFRLHDQVVGDAVVNEGIEVLGHMQGPDVSEIAERGGRRMQSALSGKGFEIRFSEYRNGFSGTGGGSRRQIIMTDKGFRPEQVLRQITLLEECLE